MPSPFPGMDPYLESPQIWPDVHHELISEIRAMLNPVLRPNYVARVELRIYISDEDDPGREALIPEVRVEMATEPRGSGRTTSSTALAVSDSLLVPTLIDDEIKEACLAIKHVESEDLVTVIEVLSPTNKIKGSQGRKNFMQKKRNMVEAGVNWVEIDMLRAGLPSVTHPPLVVSDYRVLVARASLDGRARYWPFSVRPPLPVVPIPLRGQDPDALLDLGAVFRLVYDRAAYDLSLNYRVPPRPPLTGEDATWAKELLRERNAR